MKPGICLAVTYIAKEGHERAVAEALIKMQEHTRKEPGNLIYIAHQSPTNPRQFFLYEQYKTTEDLDVHRAASYFKELLVDHCFGLLESRTPVQYIAL
ncbi:hypothetical protein M427DRAFT_51080 [Gonapodya prolifera JEL478]|uniref:ABM domain-containing protein n=1 Tax=Gonapodya prolifera (strain JEL478) TaxID=1344416 RepID=A0A139AY82_GONPJ|nr:hypothetical protein M427DRAFT_51080 [Gonapodya prolifera JEL478]|eukprot:KXS21679.1 hypothetical protein M427DRAFT_51080 [Gonapodya prolifera JEL478]